MAPPLPLAIVMSSFAPGGTERQMLELLRRLDRRRWRVHVACFHTRGAWFDRIPLDAAVTTFPVRSFRRPAAFFVQLCAFARWCRQTRIAVVHTVDMPATIFGLPGAAAAGVPLRIANRREIDPGRTMMKMALQRAAYGFAHTIVANCNAVRIRLRREGVPARKVVVIRNGVDVESIHPISKRERLRRIAVIANLRPEKGHDVFIDAAAAVVARFPDARFLIVGDGPERQRLCERAEACGVSPVLTFAGYCDDIPARLAESDLFVLPSRSEALPNAVLEAMAAALPIVASHVGGVPELIQHERTGLLVAPGEPTALAAQLCRLMDDSALAYRLGTAARAAAQRHASFDRMTLAFESLYLSRLSDRGSFSGRQFSRPASI
jgi:glycosyltransferase involved in cell wall biosynthesis